MGTVTADLQVRFSSSPLTSKMFVQDFDEEPPTTDTKPSTQEIIDSAISLLEGADHASGDERDFAAFNLATQLRDLGVSQDKALDLMRSVWNHGNTPPLTDAELAKAVDRAYDKNVARAVVLLENAVNASGDARDEAAFDLALQIAALGVPQAKALELMADIWNPGNIPPLTANELAEAVDRAYDETVASAVVLLKNADNASGDARDFAAFSLAAQLDDLGIPKDMAVELMADIWNPGNMPPLTNDELTEMVDRAYDDDVARTVVLLKNVANTSGDDRDDVAFKLAKQIDAIGVPQSKALELMGDLWNPGNHPPLDDGELAAIVDLAYNGQGSDLKDSDIKDKDSAFDSTAQNSILELVTDGTDQEGNKPVTVEYETKAMAIMKLWAELEWDGDHGLSLLKMLTKGEKRVKIFCPAVMDKAIKIFVDNDSIAVVSIGRRYDPITETLTWSGETWKVLKYCYDQPDVTIIQKTFFRDSTGKRVADPTYDKSKGGFYTATEAIGALIVQYNPGYSLFKIKYGTGEELVSRNLFEEMQKCWLYGDIHKASVPPVRLVAISDRGAVSAQFERSFWPNGFPGIKLNVKELKDLYLEVQGTRETATKMVPLNAEEPGTMYGVKHTTYVEGKSADGRSFALRFLNT